MGRRPERTHSPGARRPPRPGSVARAPRRVDAATRRRWRPGPWPAPVLPRAARRRRAVPADPAIRRRPGWLRLSSCSTRPSAPPMPPTRSTGSTPHRTVRSSPSARARPAARTPSCACSTRRTAPIAVRPSRRRGRAAWHGSPTDPASPTRATPPATSTTGRCTSTGSATRGRTIRSCGRQPDDPQAWPSVTLSPDGAWLLVHVMVGWSQVDVHLCRPRHRDVDDGRRR